jgi:hypothetical protein
MNFSSSSTHMVDFDMRTTPTTGMTVLSGKKVSALMFIYVLSVDFLRLKIVWVGPLVVKELKRIVEASEITKCASVFDYMRS